MLITFILSILIIIESINTQINPLNSNNNNIKTKININANRSYFSYSPMSYSDGNKASASEFDIIYDESDEYLNSSPSKTTNQHQKSGENHNNNINNNQNYVLPVENADLKVEFCDKCDLYIGGLFPVHAPKYARQVNPLSSYSTNTGESSLSNEPISPEFFLNSKLSCGEIKKERGIQRLEAMLFAIDLINNSTSLLPHIRIGTRIYDTCDRDTIALEKCVNFVSDYFILNDDNYVNDFTCVPPGSSQWSSSQSPSSSLVTMIPHKNKHSINKRKVIGVIGAASSSVSIQVANLLRLFQVPQISYASTSPELSNKERFPFFSRVLPSDTLQAEAMANLVHDLDWNYIATLNEEGNLGGIDSFIVHAKARKICISGSYTLSQTASEDDVRIKLTEMYNERNARGVVMFLQDHNIRKILRIVKNLNYTGHFLWIASDSWGTKKESIESNDEAAEGAITFSPKSYEIKEFNEYFKKLKPKTNTRNPWFVEFWEEQFNCTMDVKKSSATYIRRTGRRLCTGEENLNITQDSFIHFVIDSVYAMAHAIEKLVSVDCRNMASRDELIKCQKNYEFKGIKLLKEIRNVEFTSITGRKVKFIKDKENSGDGLAPYEVFQYQRLNGPDRKYGYQKITEWEKDKPFFLDRSKLKWPKSGGGGENNEDDNTNDNKMPRSVCKEECGMGEIKQGDDCCWVCVRCEENEYVAPDRKQCTKCPNGFGPNENKTMCQKLIIEYLTFNSPFTIVPLIFSSIGILFTGYTIFVFIRFNNTPIIKASGRELCYVLLAGIMSCYLITFPLVMRPTMMSCYILRFGVSLSLTVCLSALFTKTNRLSRIFNNSIKQVRQASYVSPRSQLVICFSIVSVQVVCILIWTATSHPGTMYDYEDPKRVILQCKLQNSHLALSFMYNMFLVVLCTIYAVKTRKIPENFNEARFIGFTMYSICIIWVAFIPIYFGTTAAAGTSKSPKNNYKIQLTTLAMCLSLSGTVILFCLFLPKLRVVLLKPDKNVRSKSSNIVKAVYKSHQQSVKESVIALQTSNSQHGHQPPTSHNNNNNTNNSTANQPTTNEKSLTIATGVSSISTPSSPGASHKKPMLVTVNNTNQKQLNQSASAFIKQPSSGEMVTPVKLKKVSISSNTQSFKLSKPSVELKAAAAEQLKTAGGEQKSMETNVTAALTNAVENLHDLSLKLYENSTTSSATPTNTNVKSSSTSSLLTLLNTNNNPNTNNTNANKNPVETFSIENQNELNSPQNWCAEVNVPNAKISDYSVVELDQDDEDDELIDQEELEFIQVADKNYKKFLINALAIKRSQSEDVNELIIDDSMMMISNSSNTTNSAANGNTHVKHLPTKLPTTNDLYDYYILKPRVKAPAGSRPAAPANNSNVSPSGTDHAMSTNNNNSNNSSSGGIVELTRSSNSNSNSTSLNSATVTNPNMSASDTRTSDLANLTIRDVYDVDQCQDLMNEEAVRNVVEKCFHQIAKKNKLSSPCIYIKKKPTASSDPSHPTEIKLIKIKPNSEKFRKIRQSIANATNNNNNNNNKTPNNNFAQQKSTTSNNADDETLINSSSSDSSICSSSATSSSIDNQNIKQTVVEKAVDLLNAPTNTLILSSTNEVNELYSVKITFV